MTASAASATNAGVAADTANLIETVWSKLKDAPLDAATEICGLSKNHQWTWSLVVEWTGGWNYTREAYMVQSLQGYSLFHVPNGFAY